MQQSTKIISLKTHVGVQFSDTVVTNLKEDPATQMELHPSGGYVYVIRNGEHVIIPLANLHYAKLEAPKVSAPDLKIVQKHKR